MSSLIAAPFCKIVYMYIIHYVVSRSQTTPSVPPGGTEGVVWLRETIHYVLACISMHTAIIIVIRITIMYMHIIIIYVAFW